MRSVRLVEPASSRGGKRFEAVIERGLYGLAEHVAASMPGRPGDVILVPEMPSPIGLPDFVALVGGQTWLNARRSANVVPILSEIDCSVLSVLSSRRALSVPTIANRLGWTRDHVEPVVARLARTGAAILGASGGVMAVPGMKPQGSLFAIEAKVKDWRRAVIQGRGYRTWANNYVLVLGELGPAALERAQAETRADGAGLYTGDGWVVRPRARVPSAARQMQGFEYVFAALASDPSFGSSE